MSKLNLLSGMFTLIPSLVKQGTDLLDEQLQWLSQLGVTSYQALYVAALEQDTETEAETDCDEEDNMSQLTAMKTTECCLHMTSSIISMLPSGIAHNVQLIGVVVTMAGFDLVKKQGPANGKVNMYKIDNCVAVAAPSFLSNLSTLLSEFTDDVQPSQPAAENVWIIHLTVYMHKILSIHLSIHPSTLPACCPYLVHCSLYYLPICLIIHIPLSCACVSVFLCDGWLSYLVFHSCIHSFIFICKIH